MKRFNITTQKGYSKNGEDKKTYPQVGKLTYFEASGEKEAGYKLELNMFPDTKFYIFEDNKETTEKEIKTIQLEEEIKIQDEGDGIPF